MPSLRLSLLALVAVLAQALATPISPFNDGIAARGINDTVHILSADDIHANVLSSWPAERVTTSPGLSKFIDDNLAMLTASTDATIYLKDKKAFVTLDKKSLTKRVSGVCTRQ